ncbi:hypothetical protein [Crenobacter cavernae]|uniref:Uncharacterized protein n=1 Tax=Crenobacter cavernae TaxID=2290923 RepID=A0A345Y473_9NEIS|nr:hypothetical protein [Crenobacter cavernae]AXK38725.1 hypothetical protein DWG20_04375 [Crenobacter cavernae]
MPTVPFLSCQRGASTLLVSLILVASTGMAAAYAHQQTQRHSQSTTSNYRYQQAFANAELGLAEAKKALVSGRVIEDTGSAIKLKSLDGKTVYPLPTKSGIYETSLKKVTTPDPTIGPGRQQYRLVSDGFYQDARAQVSLLVTLEITCAAGTTTAQCKVVNNGKDKQEEKTYGNGPRIRVGANINTKRLSGSDYSDLNVRGDSLLMSGHFAVDGDDKPTTDSANLKDNDPSNDRNRWGPHEQMNEQDTAELAHLLDTMPKREDEIPDDSKDYFAVWDQDIFRCGNQKPPEPPNPTTAQKKALKTWHEETLLGFVDKIWRRTQAAGKPMPAYLVLNAQLLLGDDGTELGDCEVGWKDMVAVAPQPASLIGKLEHPTIPTLVVTGNLSSDASLIFRNMGLIVGGSIGTNAGHTIGWNDQTIGRTGKNQSILQVLISQKGQEGGTTTVEKETPSTVSQIDPSSVMNAKYWADL